MGKEDSNKVYLPVTGEVNVGLPGKAKAPTDARSELDKATWPDALGYVGADGLAVSGLIEAGDALRDWWKKKIRVVPGEADPSITLPSIQVDSTMAKMLVGDGNVKVTPATAEHGEVIDMGFTGEPGPERSLCFSMKDGNRRIRVYVYDGQVTELSDVSFKPDDNTYSMTISLNKAPDGCYVHFIYDDGVVTGA